jgi:O-acetyl-ADP-ribose deacetylase
LTDYLKQIGRKHVDPGTVVVVKPTGTPYRAIIHAVAVNAFYESSPALVRSLVRSSLLAAAESGARTVALTALATGYGKLRMSEFACGLVDVVAEDFSPVQEVTIVVRGADDAKEVSNIVPAVRMA